MTIERRETCRSASGDPSRARARRLRSGPSWSVILLLAVALPVAADPPVQSNPVRLDIIAAAADAMKDTYRIPGEGSFQIRNYTDRKVKTCFYYPDDSVMLIPLGIKGDKDDCYSTPAAGKKDYRTDDVPWSKFARKPGYHHTLQRHLNVKVFRKNKLGIDKLYCKRKGIFHPDQLRIQKDGKSCKMTVVRTWKPKYLRNQGITKAADVLRWSDAHKEDISYLVARNKKYVFVSFRGTSNNANKKMNGELTLDEAGGDKGEVRESRLSARPTLREGATVHFGWWKVSGKAFDQIEPTVRDWAGKSGKKREIILTGHSMGGPVSMYTAFRFMDAGYENVHLVTFGAPRVTSKSFVEGFNALAEEKAVSVSIIERPDDPRLDDWTVKMRKLGTITIYEPDRYAGHLVEFPSGCKDPHSGDDYYKQAKNLDYACVTGDEEDEPSPRPPSRRRRAGAGGAH